MTDKTQVIIASRCNCLHLTEALLQEINHLINRLIKDGTLRRVAKTTNQSIEKVSIMKNKTLIALIFTVTCSFSFTTQAAASKTKPIDPQRVESVWYAPILDFFSF